MAAATLLPWRGLHSPALRTRMLRHRGSWLDAPAAPAHAVDPTVLATSLKYVAFDLETVALLPSAGEEAPLPGIACIGYAYYNLAGTPECRLLLNAHAITPEGTIPAGIPPGVGGHAAHGAAADADGLDVDAEAEAEAEADAANGPALTQAQVRAFVELLWHKFHNKDCRIVTWSGTASDFRLLHAAVGESPEHRRMVLTMCLQHVDVPLLTICTHGRVMGLAQVAAALRLPQKPANSAQVPELWRRPKQRPLVVHHVKHDATVTLELAIRIALRRSVHWRTLAGAEAVVPVYVTLCRRTGALCIPSVEQALRTRCVPLHYTLRAPHTREACAGWLRRAGCDLVMWKGHAAPHAAGHAAKEPAAGTADEGDAVDGAA